MRSDIRFCIFCFYFLYEKSDFHLSKNEKGISLTICKSPVNSASFYAIAIKQQVISLCKFSCSLYRHPSCEFIDFSFDLSGADQIEICTSPRIDTDI